MIPSTCMVSLVWAMRSNLSREKLRVSQEDFQSCSLSTTALCPHASSTGTEHSSRNESIYLMQHGHSGEEKASEGDLLCVWIYICLDSVSLLILLATSQVCVCNGFQIKYRLLVHSHIPKTGLLAHTRCDDCWSKVCGILSITF